MQRTGYGIKKAERVAAEKKVAEFVEMRVRKEEMWNREFLQPAPAGKQSAVTVVVKGRGIEVEIYAGVELPVIEAICRAVRHAE